MRECVNPEIDLDALDVDVLGDRDGELVGLALAGRASVMFAVPIQAPRATRSFSEVDCAVQLSARRTAARASTRPKP